MWKFADAAYKGSRKIECVALFSILHFLMKYLPKVPDDAYVKVETTKILKQHKAYMAQFEEMLNDEKIA